jgi:hypothetical protein
MQLKHHDIRATAEAGPHPETERTARGIAQSEAVRRVTGDEHAWSVAPSTGR